MNWRLLEESGVTLDSGSLSNQVDFQAIPFEWELFLTAGSVKIDPTTTFHTFTRPIPRDQPGFAPAELNDCDVEAKHLLLCLVVQQIIICYGLRLLPLVG